MTKIRYVLTSKNDSRTCDNLILVHRTPVWLYLSLSTAANRSSAVKNQAVTGELGKAKQANPNTIVNTPASR